MGKEEASLGVVGVSISLRVLVMDAVVTGPFYDVILRAKHSVTLPTIIYIRYVLKFHVVSHIN